MVDLEGDGKIPLYEKIYHHIRTEIVEGRIPRGEKLPSTRLLAGNLAVSRSTVEMAYDQLLAEGYIRAEPCRGFFVCDISGLYQTGGQMQRSPEEPEREKGRAGTDFSPYAVDTEHFPFAIWRKITANILADEREELLDAGDGQGEYGLRDAIAGYLHQARGVVCSASQIVLGAGNEYLEMLMVQLLGRGRTILMENPGYTQAYRTFFGAGWHVELFSAGEALSAEFPTVSAPAERGTVSAAASGGEEAGLIYVMPSHQFPLGTVMPFRERLRLLSWAAEKEERFLIEDDHDSEFRYRGKPVPSLQSAARHGKVIYLGTFSKSIAPSLRVSYMVLPPVLLERYHRKCGFYSVTVPVMQQKILHIFLREGHFERHLNRMRGIYRVKHDFLLGELKKRSWVGKISGDHAGLHLLVEVRTEMDERELCRRARAEGIIISGLSQYDLSMGCCEKTGGCAPQLLLGYGGLNETEMKRGLAILDYIVEEEQK